MPHAHPLAAYWSKRNFAKTPEPRGRVSRSRGRPRFVVQMHHAGRLHWDLRLEVEGVLKSWALPRGPSLDPRDARMAIPTEDHPLQYARFEGEIPAGQYGAGRMIVWDEGTYELLGAGRAADGHARGRLELLLNGRKLRGGFVLLRPRGSRRDPWQLVKLADEEADAEADVVSSRPGSVRDGRRSSRRRAATGRGKQRERPRGKQGDGPRGKRKGKTAVAKGTAKKAARTTASTSRSKTGARSAKAGRSSTRTRSKEATWTGKAGRSTTTRRSGRARPRGRGERRR